MRLQLLFIVLSIFFISCQNEVIEALDGDHKQHQKEDKKALTLILDETEDIRHLLTKVTAEQLVFKKGVQLFDFSDYEYIVSVPSKLAPRGFLRKVTSIRDQSGTIVINTSPAKINDLINEVHFSEKSTFVPKNPEVYKDIAKKNSKKVNYAVKRAMDFDYEFTEFSLDLDETWDADSDFSTTYDQVRVTGNLTIQPSLEVDIDISAFQLNEFKSVMNVTTNTDLKLDWKNNTPIDFSNEVANIDLPPTTFQLGWLPIVINHNLLVVLDIGGNVSARVTSSFSGSVDVETGIQYLSTDDQWSFINNTDNFEMNFVPYNASTSFTMNTKLSQRFTSSIFEIGQVGMRSTQNFNAQANYNGSLDSGNSLNWDAKADITFGAFTDLFFYNIPEIPNSWDEDLWFAEYNIGSGFILVD